MRSVSVLLGAVMLLSRRTLRLLLRLQLLVRLPAGFRAVCGAAAGEVPLAVGGGGHVPSPDPPHADGPCPQPAQARRHRPRAARGGPFPLPRDAHPGTLRLDAQQ